MPEGHRRDMMSDLEWLTFDEAAVRLGITRDSLRRMALRKRRPKRPGNDGRARVGLSREWLAARQTGQGGAADGAADGPAAGGAAAADTAGRGPRQPERQ